MLPLGRAAANILGLPASSPLIEGGVSPRMRGGLNQQASWWGSEN